MKYSARWWRQPTFIWHKINWVVIQLTRTSNNHPSQNTKLFEPLEWRVMQLWSRSILLFLKTCSEIFAYAHRWGCKHKFQLIVQSVLRLVLINYIFDNLNYFNWSNLLRGPTLGCIHLTCNTIVQRSRQFSDLAVPLLNPC